MMKDKYIRKRFETDILIIGGGFAGVFAAVRARQQSLNVILVDKGCIGRSGQTPWADSFHVFDENKGCDKEEFRSKVAKRGDNINIEGFLDMLMDDSKNIFEELKDWGAVGDAKFGKVLAEKVKTMGVNVLERTMLTHLIKKDDRVIGGMGFSLDKEYEAVIINAKAVINCAGAGSYKANGYPIQGLTFDGDAMSYRVGAEISGKEFNDFHTTLDEYPGSSWYLWGGKWGVGLYEENDLVPEDRLKIINPTEKYLLVKDGLLSRTPKDSNQLKENVVDPIEKRPVGPPVPKKPDGVVPEKSPEVKLVGPSDPPPIMRGGATAGMSLHKAEGVFPNNGQATFESCVEGLYAAGDSLASMLGGSHYPGLGFSSAGSCVQGARAGDVAAEYVKRVGLVEIDEDIIEKNCEEMFCALNREQGFDPYWVIQQLQNTMIPYYVIYVKEEKRLTNALDTIMYLQKNVIPKIQANDMHELKLAHECKNMFLNAEMKLRASLYRTESRGTHYREDYPKKNDKEWMAWVVINGDEYGNMTLRKVWVNN